MWPKLSNIHKDIVARIKSTDPIEASKLNCFVRVIANKNKIIIWNDYDILIKLKWKI